MVEVILDGLVPILKSETLTELAGVSQTEAGRSQVCLLVLTLETGTAMSWKPQTASDPEDGGGKGHISLALPLRSIVLQTML